MGNLILALLISLFTILIYCFLKKRILKFLNDKKLSRVNYQDRTLYTGGGLLILLPSSIVLILCLLINPSDIQILYLLMLFLLTFVGLIDDVLGDSKAKGLVGHIKKFLSGNLSTGIIKAGVGFMVGILISVSLYTNLIGFLLNILIFPLSVNLINLFDLRPGRSIKVYIFLQILMLIIARSNYFLLIIPILTSLVLYFKGEMHEDYMLGDAGSNLLGGVLGFYSIIVLNQREKFIYFIFLLGIHVFTEYYSISKWIENKPLIKKIDQLGQKANVKKIDRD